MLNITSIDQFYVMSIHVHFVDELNYIIISSRNKINSITNVHAPS